MSKQTKQKSSNETARVNVGRLAQQDKELKNAEAENIRGGGGASGGVIEKSGETSNKLGQ